MPARLLATFYITFAAALSIPAASRAQEKGHPLITIEAGKAPVILSAPHGGRKPVPGVPARKGEGVKLFVTVRDENTAEIADLLAAELEKALKAAPYRVTARFERKYADVNRPPEDAYESANAKPIYDAYHQALEDACKDVKKKFGRGLLLDLHGQMGRPDSIVRGTAGGKSVQLLVERFGVKSLTGPKSLMGRLAENGFDVFPKVDSTDKEDPRFGGGYIVRTYGSHQGNAIDAIQLEIGSKYRDRKAIDETAKGIAAAVARFVNDYVIDK